MANHVKSLENQYRVIGNQMYILCKTNAKHLQNNGFALCSQGCYKGYILVLQRLRIEFTMMLYYCSNSATEVCLAIS